MAKGKPKTPTTNITPGGGAWEASLASTLVNNEELKVNVYLISPSKVEDKLQLQLLGGAVETNVREKFIYIDKEALVTAGKEFGKSKDSGSKASYPEVYASLKTADEVISASVLAKLLKVKILEYRDSELSKRNESNKGKGGNTSKSPAKSASPDKGKKDAKKGGKKSPSKKDGGGVDADSEIERGKCPLKKRGEETEGPVKIVDYPEGSPDMFVLCVGFDQCDILAECLKTNLPITALVTSSAEEYSKDFSFMEHIAGNKVSSPEDLDSPEMAARVQATQETIDKFWADVAEKASEVPLPPSLVSVGFEEMQLPRVVLDNELKKDNEKMDELMLQLYKNVVDKIYALHSCLAQYHQYNKGMDLVEVADLTATTEDGELVHPLDMRYYNKMISLLPYESATHVSVLNCMLEQVCEEALSSCDEVRSEARSKEPTEDPVKNQLGSMIHSLPLSLQQQTEFEEFMALKHKKVEEDDQPAVLKAADEIGIKSFHLTPDVYPLKDQLLLKQSIANTFLELPTASPEILAKTQSLAYETEMFCGEIQNAVVNKALRQFAFEDFDSSTAKRDISPLKGSHSYFWDVELLLKPGDMSGEDIHKLKNVPMPDPKLKLDHYNYSTTFEKDALLQVLGEAFYDYPYCERTYHRHENAMLLIFHAGFSDRKPSQSCWSERLHTEIGFHYFMSRTRDKFSHMIANLPPLTPAPPPSEPSATPAPVTPVAEIEAEPEFQMPENRLEGFKKRSELKEAEQERQPSAKKGSKAAPAAKSPEKKTQGSRKGSPSPKRKGSPAKRSGPSRTGSAKSTGSKVDMDARKSTPEPEVDIILDEDPASNMFVGFKLCNQILEATGKVSHCHPADGSLVRVEEWGFDGKRPKSRISLLKDGHVLSMNYDLKSDMDLRKEKQLEEEHLKTIAETEGESNAENEDGIAKSPSIPATEEECEIPLARNVSFNAQLKGGLSMSFKKPGKPAKVVQMEGDAQTELEAPPLPVLVVSIPTGLVIEYCEQQEDSDCYAIRQSYERRTELKHRCEQVQAKACAEEVSRLHLSDGSVVKYMKNGETVVLYPDGGYSIRQVPPPPPPPPSEPTSEPTSEAGEPVETPPPPPYVKWEVTKESGEREQLLSNGDIVAKETLQCYTATDPESHEVMFTRMDNILSVTRPDGTRIVDHTDGTRITTVTSGNGDTSYRVECVGYATLKFNGEMADTLFGTLSKITSKQNKKFVIEDGDGTVLNVSPYQSTADFLVPPPVNAELNLDALHSVREHGELTFTELGVHHFSLENNICFQHTDLVGNIFNVTYDGKIISEKPDSHIIQHLDHFYRENKTTYHDVEERFKPPMRLFVIHSDKTGTEIMDKEKCRALLETTDPNVVRVKEDVESDDLANAYTFLTPFYSSPGSKWIRDFEEANIVPGGLVYSGNVKPPHQIMGGWEKRVSIPNDSEEPALPPAIHYHQVIEDSAIDSYRRELVVNGLKSHSKWLIERELHSNKASLPDNRTEREKGTAENTASKIGRAQSVPKSHSLPRTPQDDLLAGEEYTGALPNLSKENKSMDIVDSVTRKYSSAVSTNTFKLKIDSNKGVIPQAKWDQLTNDKKEVNILKSDLRNFRVPPYFESKFGQAFLNSLKEGPDMQGLSNNVPSPVLGTPSDKSIEGNKVESLSTSMILIDGEDDIQGSSASLLIPGTTPRPGNPTPNVAKGSETDLKVSEQKSKGPSPPCEEPSPKPNRSLSPHKEEVETPTHDILSSRQNSVPLSGTVKSLHVDAKGDPRKNRVKIPRSIKGYKPGAEPNERFLTQEEPVRRGVKTSSVLAASKRMEISEMRGFQVYPPEVSFGVLCPNGTYATTVTLKNVGIDSCRFQIKCPRNSDGVSVGLHSETNFVAAGMSVKFDVCITAPEVTDIGHVSLDVCVVMEMETFKLPVLATVLPTEEYNERSKSGRLTRLPQHIKIIDVSSVLNSTSSSTGLRGSGTPMSLTDWTSFATFT